MSSNANLKIGLSALVVAGVAAGTLPLFLRNPSSIASSPRSVAVHRAAPTGDFVSSLALAAVSKDANAPIGTVLQKAVSLAELAPGERYKLYQAELQIYNTIDEILSQRYRKEVLERYRQEKKLADINVAENDYLGSKAKVDEAELSKIYESNKENPRLAGKSDEEKKNIIRQALEGRNKQNVMRNLLMEGKMKGEFAVAIPAPVEPIIPIPEDGSPFMGPKDAPVTIVEFADYQCPYCARMVPVLQNLVKKYNGKVRWVYRDFPLREIHPEAFPAAVAAKCGGEQGKYFEFHNALYENYHSLNSQLYSKIANDLKLDIPKFDACLKGPTAAAEVNKGAEFAQEIGINGTPAYFINNKRLPGAGDEAEFSRIIDTELAKLGK